MHIIGVAVAGDAGVDQAGVHLGEDFVAQAQPAQGTGAPVVQKDVRLFDHLLERGFASGVA